MKTPSQFLMVGVALLCIAVSAGLYIWYEVQMLDKKIGETETSIERIKAREESVPKTNEIDTKNTQTNSAQEEPVVSKSTAESASTTVVNLTNLTDTQRDIVRAFGVSGDSFEVTQEMLTCAKKAVEGERFDAILNGSAPTPLESMRLLPCFTK